MLLCYTMRCSLSSSVSVSLSLLPPVLRPSWFSKARKSNPFKFVLSFEVMIEQNTIVKSSHLLTLHCHLAALAL